MNYSNIATILNTVVMPNAEGVAVTVAENLSNIVEYGTAVASLTVDQLKDMNKKLVVGVSNWVLARLVEENHFKLLRDTVAFGGGIQRIMASENFTAQESHLLNLSASDGSYHDGKYYGLSLSSRVYTETKTFKIVHSVAEEFERTMFMNAEDVAKWFGLVEVTERNSIINKINALEKRVIMAVIKNAYTDGRKVQLITGFNTMCGYTGESAKTLADIKADRDLWAYFSSYCKECVARVIDYVKEPSKKYNDGTVLTFSSTDKINVILNSQFANDIKYLANPIEFSPNQLVDYDTVTAWQNIGTDILPDYSVTTEIKLTDGAETPTVTTISNVVGVVYDVEGAGITFDTNGTRITVEDVGAEGFRNIHHHVAQKYYVDNRLPAVVFTLD